MTTTMTETAPLQDFRIVDVRENWYQPIPGAPRQPGGSCWHCGTGIAIEVVIRNSAGEEHAIGTTCAERVGMDRAELKAFLAAKYAEERAAAALGRRLAREAERDNTDARLDAEVGAHGTEARWAFGCRPYELYGWAGGVCPDCIEAAPHGTLDHFWAHECPCGDCVQAVMATDSRYYLSERPVLVDLSTGEVADAHLVPGQYGTSWKVDNGPWVPAYRKRRDTVASRGYTYASALFLLRRPQGSDYRQESWRVLRLTDPILDEWKEAIHAGAR